MSIGSEIGSGAGAGDGARGPAAVLRALSPHDWWDFTDSDSLSLSGSNITSVANNGASSDVLAHGGGVYITHDGSKGVCSGSQNSYTAGAAGDRDFLHNGDGAEIFVIHAQESASNEQFFLISNDISGSSIVPGLRMSSFQTGGAKEYISRFGYGGNHLFNQSSDGVLTVDMPVISSLKVSSDVGAVEGIVFSEDGVPVIEQSDLGVLSGTSHDGPLKAMVSYKGDVYGIIIFDRVLTDSERSAAYRALRSYYGLNRQANLTLLIGASNADGLGGGGSLSSQYQGVIGKSYIYAYRDGNVSLPINCYPHEQANSHVDTTSSSAGLDLSLMDRLVSNSGEKEFLLKSAVSGSDLYAQWNPADQPEYSTAWDGFAVLLMGIKDRLRSIGFIPNFRGCIVGLGENDATASFRANDYQDNQSKLNAQVRAITHPDLPIVLVACSTEEPDDTSGRSDGNMALQSTVRTAQSAVALAENNTQIYQPITTGTLAWNESTPNGIHFDMASLEQMGIEIADLLY